MVTVLKSQNLGGKGRHIFVRWRPAWSSSEFQASWVHRETLSQKKPQNKTNKDQNVMMV